jgi:hypothetical protein
VSVLDGRIEIVDEIKIADENLQNYLVNSFKEIIDNPSFKGALSGHFAQYGRLAEDRAELLEQKLISIKVT